jgi:hypothetical protein
LYASLMSSIRAIYPAGPSHPPCLDHYDNIWWSVQVMNPLITQFSSGSCFFLLLGSKCSPQHPESMLFKWENVYSMVSNYDLYKNDNVL